MAAVFETLQGVTEHTYDMSRFYMWGCSQGSAFVLWQSQCLYGQQHAVTIPAFATHSTGIKQKVRVRWRHRVVRPSRPWGVAMAVFVRCMLVRRGRRLAPLLALLPTGTCTVCRATASTFHWTGSRSLPRASAAIASRGLYTCSPLAQTSSCASSTTRTTPVLRTRAFAVFACIDCSARDAGTHSCWCSLSLRLHEDSSWSFPSLWHACALLLWPCAHRVCLATPTLALASTILCHNPPLPLSRW
jgi:hypothetical protein